MLTKDRKIQRSRFENSFAEVSNRIGIGVFDERAKIPIKKPGLGFLIFGVILPAIALIFEVNTHTMAGVLFDPFPSVWHVLLFSFIPISNLIVYLAVRINLVSLYAITSLMSGFAMGIAILYSLMFATKLPAIGTTFLNHSELAFLVMFHPLLYAPLLSVSSLFNAGHVITLLGARQKAFFDGAQLKHFGHIVILIMVLSIEAPSTLTRIYLSKALEPDFSSRQMTQRYNQDAVNWLRSWGSREVMLRACYERSGRATDILGSLYEDQHPISVDEARNVFYLVTGESFNEVAIPASFRATLKHNGAMQDVNGLNGNASDEFDIDTDIAGSKVSGFARGLSTSDSSITGKIDATNSIASFDWTCTFDNATYVPREARAQIKLPPGACVSGATIWLDGQKKVATIEERSQARSTYVSSVYNHKKDPLLVSMVGPSTVLVQCYPVVRGQVTKIDLHIIAPLESLKNEKAQLILPVFCERNFAFKNDNKIKLDCATKFDIKNNVIEFERSAQNNAIFNSASNPRPDTLYVVVDGSVKMQPYMAEVVEGLKALPIADVQIIKVLDGETKYKNKAEALSDLSSIKCTGGQDNSQCVANSLAQSLVKLERPSAVLWIHGTQPVSQPAAEHVISEIFRELKNSNTKKYIYDYQIMPGAIKLLEDMDLEQSASGVREVASTGHPKVDLENFYSTLKTVNQSSYFEFAPDKNASEDLNVLKAYHATMGNFSLYGYQNPTLYLCRQYHFVSPVTSFVVLPDESQINYDEEAVSSDMAPGQCMIAENLKTNIATAVAPPMEPANAPKQECKEMADSSLRDMKKGAPTMRIKNIRSKAEAGAGGASGSGGYLIEGRARQNKDRIIAESKMDSPARKQESYFNPMGKITDKLSSLSQSASQTTNRLSAPSASPESSMKSTPVDPRYGQTNEVGGLKTRKRSHGFLSIGNVTFILVLVVGLIFLSFVKSVRLRK
jgi:hypothetical protein